ncbi:MAG: DUF1800 domain-containing protein [Anaerolineales bacterium]
MSAPLSRRDFLRISGLGGTLAALAACNPLQLGEGVGARATTVPPAAPILDQEGLILHALRRFTFGPTAADLDTAANAGLEAWLERQLAADVLDLPEVEERLSEFDTLEMSPIELRDLQENGRVARELGASAVVRQIYSSNQLFEVLVDFWTNHFNIFAYSPPELFLKGVDDRVVIRTHALGKFPDMLTASAHSPAMLVYLDNARSQHPSPNENYARELLELHTLGVDGGYTYADIQAVARAFAGWSVGGFRRTADRAGEFTYLRNWHDPEPKSVLGDELPGGKADGDRVLKLLAEHPSTARFIATKLSERFVSDAPPKSIVERVAETYMQTGGDIPAMIRTIAYSDEFAASAGLKLKRPLDFVVSAIRVTGAEGRLDRVLRFFLQVLGQVPFGWPTPDGYPDYAAAWANTNQSLYRWNLALLIASGMLPGISTKLSGRFGGYSSIAQLVDDLSLELLAVRLPDDARSILVDFGESQPDTDLVLEVDLPSVLAGLILSTPHFQIR